MWTYVIESGKYKFRLISEWAGGVTLGVNENYDVTDPAFVEAFSYAMKEKDKIAEAFDFEYEVQGGNMSFARQFHAETSDEWIAFLMTIRDNEYLSEKTRGLVVDELNKTLTMQARRAQAKVVRKEFARDYDRLFMFVGRRDGFCCVECGVVTGLTLDHKKAVINGGTNDPENLQMMCRSHNSQKGAK